MSFWAAVLALSSIDPGLSSYAHVKVAVVGSSNTSSTLMPVYLVETESAGVAAKLIASAADLDALAAGVRDVPALQGWRSEVFGTDALRLCDGRVALTANGADVQIIPLD